MQAEGHIPQGAAKGSSTEHRQAVCELSRVDTILLHVLRSGTDEAEDEVRSVTTELASAHTRQLLNVQGPYKSASSNSNEAAACTLSLRGCLAKGCNLCSCSLGAGEALAWNPSSG